MYNMSIGKLIKEALGRSPQVEHTREEYLAKLTAGEQARIQDLWNYLVAHRSELGEGLDFSLALVGGIPRSVNKPNSRRNKPTLKDVDIVIATSAKRNSKEEYQAVIAADKLLRDYFNGNDTLDQQLAGPDWYMGRASNYSARLERYHKNPAYWTRDLVFATKPNEELNIRSFDVLFSGYRRPNMFDRPQLTDNGKNPYVVLYTTAAI